MKLSAAVSPARPVTVHFDGDDLHVEYRPTSYTPAEVVALQEATPTTGKRMSAAAQREALDRTIETMLRLIVSWDLEDEDGRTIPLTREALRDVPLNVFHEVQRAIAEDQAAGEAGEPSDAG